MNPLWIRNKHHKYAGISSNIFQFTPPYPPLLDNGGGNVPVTPPLPTPLSHVSILMENYLSGEIKYFSLGKILDAFRGGVWCVLV